MRIQLKFTVPQTPQTQDGVLVRNFLRQCAVSTELARAVKFRGSGFFAEGEPVLANRRVYPGQVVSALSCRRRETAWPRSRRSR